MPGPSGHARKLVVKPLHGILLVVVSATSGALTALLVARSSRVSEAAVAPSAGDELASELDALRREHAALKQALAELRSADASARVVPDARSAASSLTLEDVERLVARAFDEREKSSEPRVFSPAEVAAAVQRLLDPSLSAEERTAIWDELAARGLLDAVVAEYERRAAAAPNDTTASAELGFAYHQKLRHAASGPERGAWGRKGMEAYARALELDDTNWDARFAMAQHFGYAEMPGDALRELEVLRSQQAGRRAEAKHAAAFVMLGNMYLEQGSSAEARKVWEEGAALFPRDARLQELARGGR